MSDTIEVCGETITHDQIERVQCYCPAEEILPSLWHPTQSDLMGMIRHRPGPVIHRLVTLKDGRTLQDSVVNPSYGTGE